MIKKYCSVADCERTHCAKGLCKMHYKREARGADLSKPVRDVSKRIEDRDTYLVWANMKQRCYNEKQTGYHRYGGRGIRMCDEWKDDFFAFYDYMGKKPNGMSIDRINNDGNYEPGNVRWADKYTQAQNRAMFSSNKSGVEGVFYSKYFNSWVATLTRNGELLLDKSCNTKAEAVAARSSALRAFNDAKLVTNR